MGVKVEELEPGDGALAMNISKRGENPTFGAARQSYRSPPVV
jgi:hypothetical protein